MAKLRTSMRLTAGIAVAMAALMSVTVAAEVCGPLDFKKHPKWFRAGGYCEQLMSSGVSSVGGHGGMAQAPGGGGGGFVPYTRYVSWDFSDPSSPHTFSTTRPTTGQYVTQTFVAPTTLRVDGPTGTHYWNTETGQLINR